MNTIEKMQGLLWTDYPEYLKQLFNLRNQLRASVSVYANDPMIREQYAIVEEMVANYTAYSASSGTKPTIPFVRNGLYKDLPKDVHTIYKAAGILPFAKTQRGEVKLLLGCEDRSHKEGAANSAIWLHFGGKIETTDNGPLSTALREFTEETAEIYKYDRRLTASLESKNFPAVWLWKGKYVLFLIEFPYDPSIPEQFRRSQAQRTEKHLDQFEIQWVSLDAIDYALEQKLPLVNDRSLPGAIKLHRLFLELIEVPGVVDYLYKPS